MKLLNANYVLPITSEPIKNGAVAVENGRIVAIGDAAQLTKDFPNAAHENFNESVLMPGFVNCHSHLEITAMRGFLDHHDGDFAAWLLKLTKTRAEKLSENDIRTSAQLGAIEGVRAGVTCFGDIGRSGFAGLEALVQNGLRGILFQETEFSPQNETAEQEFENLTLKFRELQSQDTRLVKVGLSPHAPYTVSRTLFEKITELSIAENIALTIHAAESIEEDVFLREGKGFFAGIFEKAGIAWDSPKKSSVQYLHEIGVLKAKPLLAHCVTVSESDIKLIAESDSRIAHCPKSNAKFGHGIAPFPRMLEKKIAVGLGSDSMASNNTCDLLEESRFASLLARARPEQRNFLDARKIIETATFGGAKALGLQNEIGSLEVGKQADMIAISMDNPAQLPVHDIYSTLLFATNSRDVKMTMVAGITLFHNGELTQVDESEIKSKAQKLAQKML